jgi:hypothetical protein
MGKVSLANEVIGGGASEAVQAARRTTGVHRESEKSRFYGARLVVAPQHGARCAVRTGPKCSPSDTLWHNELSVVITREERVFALKLRFRFGRNAGNCGFP